jgi:hypothetical protein
MIFGLLKKKNVISYCWGIFFVCVYIYLIRLLLSSLIYFIFLMVDFLRFKCGELGRKIQICSCKKCVNSKLDIAIE